MSQAQNSSQLRIFGEDICHRDDCHQDDSLFGLLLIFGGVMLLLNSLNILTWEVWKTTIRYWPVLIILAGSRLLLGGSALGKIAQRTISIVVITTLFIYILQLHAHQLVSWIPSELMQIIQWWELGTT